MDSMRSLNTSLPSSRSRTATRPSQTPELLQAFKSAALSVTNLYKTAVNDQTRIRQEGYQDALDDLLSFLDKEDLGLQDGEGWKIREWATARIEGVEMAGNGMESDEDRAEGEKSRRRSTSSSRTRTSHEEATITASHPIQSTTPASPRDSPILTMNGAASAGPAPTILEDSQPPHLEYPPVFTFRAAQPLPTGEATMHATETIANNLSSNNDHLKEKSSSPTTASPVRVEVVNRNPRLHGRHSHARHHTRAAHRESGSGAGTKRKFHLPEFFDISNLGSPKDGSNGGGKRGRYL